MQGRTLITGASGFLGGAVVRHLHRNGWHPIIAAARSENSNLPSGVEVTRTLDLENPQDWADCLKSVETVIHCAGRPDIGKRNGEESKAACRRINTLGTLELARQAAKLSVKRFVFISSIKVNGEYTEAGITFNPESPRAPSDAYAESKSEAEEGLIAIARKTGMEVVIIRPPMIYGPGVKGNFATLVNWIRKGLPLPLGAIRNQRSLIALDNLTDFIALCADRARSPAASNQIFLVSDGEEVSTTGLLRKIAFAYGVEVRLVPVPERWIRIAANLLGQNASAQRLLSSLVVDGSKSRIALGWKPAVSMDMQLKRMAHFDSNS